MSWSGGKENCDLYLHYDGGTVALGEARLRVRNWRPGRVPITSMCVFVHVHVQPHVCHFQGINGRPVQV